MAKKVIVVDDDMYIRELYEEVLKGEGYDVDTAVNGQEALDKLNQGGYDIVLLDIMMPKIDGLGVMKALTANPPAIPNGPILMLTNLDHEPLVQEALDKGAKAFLIKANITPADLMDQIRKYLIEAEDAAAAATANQQAPQPVAATPSDPTQPVEPTKPEETTKGE